MTFWQQVAIARACGVPLHLVIGRPPYRWRQGRRRR